jgi:hypothetical protein
METLVRHSFQGGIARLDDSAERGLSVYARTTDRKQSRRVKVRSHNVGMRLMEEARKDLDGFLNPPAPVPALPSSAELGAMVKADLLTLAEARSVEADASMTKAAIIEALEA